MTRLGWDVTVVTSILSSSIAVYPTSFRRNTACWTSAIQLLIDWSVCLVIVLNLRRSVMRVAKPWVRCMRWSSSQRTYGSAECACGSCEGSRQRTISAWASAWRCSKALTALEFGNPSRRVSDPSTTFHNPFLINVDRMCKNSTLSIRVSNYLKTL